MDEEQKVEAVRDFYTDAEENKTTFVAAESMLFYGEESHKGKNRYLSILALLKQNSCYRRGGVREYIP